jgi:hypothetical protein
MTSMALAPVPTNVIAKGRPDSWVTCRTSQSSRRSRRRLMSSQGGCFAPDFPAGCFAWDFSARHVACDVLALDESRY